MTARPPPAGRAAPSAARRAPSPASRRARPRRRTARRVARRCGRSESAGSFRAAAARSMAYPVTSTGGTPSTIQCAITVPTPPPRQDAQRVHSGRHPVAVQFRGRSEHRPDVRGEGLRAAEEQPHPDLGQRRNARERGVQVGPDPVPVRRQGAEGEVVRHPVQRPGSAHRFEQTHQHAVALGPVVAVAVGVLDHRQVVSHAGDGVGDQVVVLGRLQWDADAVALTELAGPHAGGVDHDLGLDAALVGVDRRHPAALGLDAPDGDALDDLRAECLGALGHRGGDANRVGTALIGYVEAGQHVGGVQQRPHLLQFAG